MILLPYLLIGMFLVVFMIDVRKAILVAVLIRPVIDCFFDAKYAFLGIKPTEYLGIALPTLFFVKIFLSRKHSFLRVRFGWLWGLYLLIQLLGIVQIVTVGDNPILGVNYFFRVFNGFIGFFLFQEFFQTREQFKLLLIAHIVAGIFPLGVSVYQNILGGQIRSEATIGGLVRNIGFYHDAYTLRLYCFQTVAAILLYWCYFLSRVQLLIRWAMLVIAAISFMTIYKLYSKAGYLVCAEWLVVWNIARRRLIQALIIAIAALQLVMFFKGEATQTLDTVYSKEVGVFTGKEKSERMLQGRVGVWKVALQRFAEAPAWVIAVGDGSPHIGAHNDFIRALLGTGVIGLLFYLTLLGVIGTQTMVNCWRAPTPLNTVAAMLMGMWFIDAIGLVPGAYTGYQIFVWGFVGLALRGVKGLDISRTHAVPVSA